MHSRFTEFSSPISLCLCVLVRIFLQNPRRTDVISILCLAGERGGICSDLVGNTLKEPNTLSRCHRISNPNGFSSTERQSRSSLQFRSPRCWRTFLIASVVSRW